MLDKKILGEELRKARRKTGLSQKELAKKLGLSSYQQIQNYENGVTLIPMHRLIKFQRLTERDLLKMLNTLIEKE